MEENFTTGTSKAMSIPLLPYVELLGSLKSDLELSAAEMESSGHLLASGLPPLVRSEIVAFLLGISHKLLFAIAVHPEPYYRTFDIPKRSGGKRRIDAPRVFLKTIQRWILRNVLYKRELPLFVTGFVPGRSLLTNAQVHVKQKYLIKLDIKDFFPSINRRQVEAVFKSFGYPEKVNRLLAFLCTFRNSLPQGAPTSPYLANLVFLDCDLALEKLATKVNVKYTRYADDLTFSSNQPIDPHILQDFSAIIAASGFQVNTAKSRNWRPGQRLITTGMVINEKVQPPRELRRRLRAMFHQAEVAPHMFRRQRAKLAGWAAFVNMYDSEIGGSYLGIARNVKKIPANRSKETSGKAKP